MAMPRLLLFIPCYNCGLQLARTLEQLDTRIGTYFPQVLVVDNRSTDDTCKVAEQKLRSLKHLSVTLLKNNHNYHLGGSHKVALDYATEHGFTHLGVLHGDDQGRLVDLLPFLNMVEANPSLSLLGSRFMWGSRLQGYGWARILGNVGFNLLFSLACRRWLTDLGSGLNLFSVQALQQLPVKFYPDNLVFNYHLMLGLCAHNLPYAYVPISWREDDQVSNVKLFSHGVKTLRLLGAFIRHRPGFLAADHRAVPHERYEATVVYQHMVKA